MDGELFGTLLDGSLGGMIEAVGEGRVTRADLIAAAIERINERNPSLRAIATVDEGRALAMASLADCSRERRVLDGAFLSIKDTIETSGLRTTAGTTRFADHVPAADALVVSRLRGAGAIVVAKSNVPPLAGDLHTENSIFGATVNPWNEQRTAGGSSGGSAAAVASRMVPVDVGSDFAGSLRIPAAYCGVYAHRPTTDLVPTQGHIPPMPGARAPRDLLAIGPVARDPSDLERILGVIVGPAWPLSSVWRVDLPPCQLSTSAWRVAVTLDDSSCPVAHDVREGIERLVARLETLGVRVSFEHPPAPLGDIDECFGRLLGAAVSPTLSVERYEQTVAVASVLEDPYARRDALAVCQSHREWLLLQEWRSEIAARFEQFFHGFDVWLCPVTPTVAPPVWNDADRYARKIDVDGEQRPYFDQLVWTAAPAVAQLPATVAPIGVAGGLPLSVQVIGSRYSDYSTIAFAKLIAREHAAYTPPRGW